MRELAMEEEGEVDEEWRDWEAREGGEMIAPSCSVAISSSSWIMARN
jgi:hypothetical protein